MKVLDPKDAGCWFDSHRGIYIGEAVQEVAQSYGWTGPLVTKEEEFYCEAWEEADQFLDSICPEHFWFGGNDNGDWGMWRDDDQRN